ncbi:MAG: hypothetical protein ACMVY4_02425 [Minwuia sp.]|uniref:hypothetical protein n=1 Tax=Minwuia sp. TaxID=2493630 RepID=UPI003A8BEF4A
MSRIYKNRSALFLRSVGVFCLFIASIVSANSTALAQSKAERPDVVVEWSKDATKVLSELNKVAKAAVEGGKLANYQFYLEEMQKGARAGAKFRLVESAGQLQQASKLLGKAGNVLTVLNGGLAIREGFERSGKTGAAVEATAAASKFVVGKYACAPIAAKSGFAAGALTTPIGGGATFFVVYLACSYGASKGIDRLSNWVEGKLTGGQPRPTIQTIGKSGPAGPGAGNGVRVGNVRIQASTDDVNNIARGNNASAQTDIGTARGNDGGDVTITVRTNNVSTIARGSNASATTEAGVADGAGRVDASVGGNIVTTARSGESASTTVGKVSGGGRASAYVRGDVVTQGDANTEVGVSNGGNTSAYVGGNVITSARQGGSAETKVGSDSNAFVGGDVINPRGSLRVGAEGCVGHRDGKCCIMFHRGWCTQNVVPSDKGRCPPRYDLWGAMCYLYTDKRHRVD